jgi:ubiquinone/menaquinone biosynthesis C-methylase UbiE
MKTDWDNVANWYDSYLKGEDTYQAQVVAPNLLRMLAPEKGERILDIACGQGYFAKLIAHTGATVVGIDQSTALIAKAKEQATAHEEYIVSDAQKLSELTLKSVDAAFTVLALENIKNIQSVFDGAYGLLKKNGRMVLVLLHPAFRIPQHSDWAYDNKKGIQYRTIEKYMSEVAISIELNPHNKPGKKEITTTFHRPLQWYTKALKKSGFVITGIEEWISHKKSRPGPRQKAEDAARKEFPMFLALEVQKI